MYEVLEHFVLEQMVSHDTKRQSKGGQVFMEKMLHFGPYFFYLDGQKKMFSSIAKRENVIRTTCTYEGACCTQIQLRTLLTREMFLEDSYVELGELQGMAAVRYDISRRVAQFQKIIGDILKEDRGQEFVQKLCEEMEEDTQFLQYVQEVT